MIQKFLYIYKVNSLQEYPIHCIQVHQLRGHLPLLDLLQIVTAMVQCARDPTPLLLQVHDVQNLLHEEGRTEAAAVEGSAEPLGDKLITDAVHTTRAKMAHWE